MTPAEFWSAVQPSGLTAEQELVAFWQHMKDCPCGGHRHKMPPPPMRRRSRRRDTDDDVLLFIL